MEQEKSLVYCDATRMVRTSGGGPDRSSEEALVMSVERRVWPVSSFMILNNLNKGMIDYYETKSQPITRLMVWQSYRKVRANKGSAGIDEMSWQDLDKDLSSQLYKLWNRLSSGSYFPMAVKEVEIPKGTAGGTRKLGIPTIIDRIAQQVVKTHLEQIVEPYFHDSSYGYRPLRSCHQAVEKAMYNAGELRLDNRPGHPRFL